MCVILYKPVGVGPLKENWLDNAWEANDHGWGVVVRTQDGQLFVQKGYGKKEFIEFAGAFGAEVDVVAHCRIGTSGTRGIENLHPFPIYAHSKALDENPDAEPVAYLMHNGIVQVPEWDKLKSDTWHLARLWEAAYGSVLPAKMRQRGWRRRQKKRLNTYNKFVLIDRDGVAIINPTAGKWHEGVWMSNASALQPPSAYGFEYDWDDIEWEWVKSDNSTGGFYRRKQNSKLLTSSTLKSTLHSLPAYGEGSLDDEDDDFLSYLENEDVKKELVVLGDEYELVVRQNPPNGDTADHLIAEWEGANSLDDIEETLYNYDARSVAKGIQKLLGQRNWSSARKALSC